MLLPQRLNHLIHEADPKSLPVVVTIFTRGVCSFVPTFQILANQNNVQVSATGGTVGLAEWIIDGTHFLFGLKSKGCTLYRHAL